MIIEISFNFLIRVRIKNIIKTKKRNSALSIISESRLILKNIKMRQATENSDRDNLFKIKNLILIYFPEMNK